MPPCLWICIPNLFYAFHHLFVNFVTAVEKVPSNCLTIGISFRCIREALDEPLQHAPCLRICIPHLFCLPSSVIGHCWGEITSTMSDNRDCLQLPSGSTWRAIAACLHASIPMNMHFSPFLCISSLIGHCCREITFELSDNRDFLQVPSGSTRRAVPGEQKEILH